MICILLRFLMELSKVKNFFHKMSQNKLLIFKSAKFIIHFKSLQLWNLPTQASYTLTKKMSNQKPILLKNQNEFISIC